MKLFFSCSFVHKELVKTRKLKQMNDFDIASVSVNTLPSSLDGCCEKTKAMIKISQHLLANLRRDSGLLLATLSPVP